MSSYEYLPKQQWGPVFWSCIHITCLGFPKEPNEEDKKYYSDFLRSIGMVMPCYHCVDHYKILLQEYPPEKYMESKLRLFEWSVLIHNIVNKKRGQEEWSISEALKQWANRYER